MDKTCILGVLDKNGHAISKKVADEMLNYMLDALVAKYDVANGGEFAFMNNTLRCAEDMPSRIEVKICHE